MMNLEKRHITRITMRTAIIAVTPDEAEAVRLNQPDTIRRVLNLAGALPEQSGDTIEVQAPEIKVRRDGAVVRVHQTITHSVDVVQM